LDVTPKELSTKRRLSSSNVEGDSNDIASTTESGDAEFIDYYEIENQDTENTKDLNSSVSVIDIPKIPQIIEEHIITEDKKSSANTHVQSSLGVTPNQRFNHLSASSKQIRAVIKQGEEEMAEVDTAVLSAEHGSIRHDIAVESARLSAQVGAEACGINTHIGDSRREQETGFANTRYNIAEQANLLSRGQGDIRMESAENFGHTRRDIQAGVGDIRYNLAERAGDIRRELAQGFDHTNDNILKTSGDIRFQSAGETSEVIKEGLKASAHTVDVVKDARYELASRIESNADRLERGTSALSERVADRFYSVGRDLADLKQGHATLSKDIELNALKGVIEGQKNTQYLADKIAFENEKTRDLLNDHKYHDLNRHLVERNTELVNCEQDRHRYRDRYWDSRWEQNQSQFGAQFAAMQNQLQSMNQNFNSQLSETRQGMVNFGTMAGVGQTSSANNVR
jgi:hypothetical protein